MGSSERIKKEIGNKGDTQLSSVLLEVKGLETCFYIQEGVVQAVNSISYKLNKGETLAIVGESGCGKRRSP